MPRNVKLVYLIINSPHRYYPAQLLLSSLKYTSLPPHAFSTRLQQHCWLTIWRSMVASSSDWRQDSWKYKIHMRGHSNKSLHLFGTLRHPPPQTLPSFTTFLAVFYKGLLKILHIIVVLPDKGICPCQASSTPEFSIFPSPAIHPRSLVLFNPQHVHTLPNPQLKNGK